MTTRSPAPPSFTSGHASATFSGRAEYHLSMERTDIIVEETTVRTKHAHAHGHEHAQDDGRESEPERANGRPSTPGNNYKRLVVCCDGTWLDSDSGLQDGKIVPPSNVR